MSKYINGNLKNPNLFLFFAIVSSAIVLTLAGTHAYNVMEDVLENSRHSQTERSYVSDIRFFDEVLTNSALLAASTGDGQWEKRYRLFEPKLDNVIKNLIQLDTLNNLHKMLKLTDNANVSLVSMENRVFELVRVRKLNEAITIMTGSEYARQKAIYSEGLSTFIKLHELETGQLQTRLHNKATHSKWFFGLVVLLLVIVWLPIERFFRKSRAQMLKQNQELELQIQSRKESESVLNESKRQIEKTQEQLQESIKASSIGLWEWDMQTNQVYFSPEFKKQIGYKDDEVQSSPEFYFSHLHPEDAIIVNESTPQLLNGTIDKIELEYRFRQKNGSYLWMLAHTTLQRDQYGKPLRMFGSHMDITERKLAEEALRASQQLIEGIINAIPVRIFWKDKNLVYLGCNTIFAQDAGFSDQKDIIGKNDFQMGWRDQAELYRSGDRQVMESGYPNLLNEEPQTTPEGNTKILLTNKLPLKNSMGEIYGILGTSMDVTDRIAAVQEIKLKNEELQKLNAEKDKFFSIIAHDLRSPFTGFLGLTQIMAEELQDMTMDEIQSIAVSMKNSATNLFRLLENLLEWAKMQQGLIPFDPKVMKLLPIVDESIAMVLESAKSKGIIIAFNVPGDLEVFADNHILQTIIRNLVSNAVKFTPKGGKISLSAKATNDKGVEISIKDTGIGMRPKIVDNLFRLNVQTNRKGTEGEPSSGLGLFLCKEFVEKHSGKLWVESEEGIGSTFSFSLPGIRQQE